MVLPRTLSFEASQNALLRCSTFNQQHTVIVGVLWELVVNPNANVKSTAAVLFKALVSLTNHLYSLDLCMPGSVESPL